MFSCGFGTRRGAGNNWIIGEFEVIVLILFSWLGKGEGVVWDERAGLG